MFNDTIFQVTLKSFQGLIEKFSNVTMFLVSNWNTCYTSRICGLIKKVFYVTLFLGLISVFFNDTHPLGHIGQFSNVALFCVPIENVFNVTHFCGLIEKFLMYTFFN